MITKKIRSYKIIQELSGCDTNVKRKSKLHGILKKIKFSYPSYNLIIQKIPINKKFGSSNYILSSPYKKVLLITAHYDAYLLNEKSGKTTPGANDNSSGVGIVLESIEHLRNLPVDFVFFGAEEKDCMGAKEFLKRNKKEILEVVKLDCCGSGGEKGILIPSKIKIKNRFLKTDKQLNHFFLESIKKRNYNYCLEDVFATGDHEEFIKQKIPATTIQGEDVKFFGLENGKYNFNKRIMHTKEDNIKIISREFLMKIKTVLIKGVKLYFHKK
jgi:Zn-dependent M28 family amino/carboxypeptidase